MFVPNDGHTQQTIFNSTDWMDKKVRDKFNKSWAPIFYEHVFKKIDEDPFAVLYGKTGKPNFPVNILLSLEYIKHMRNCSDIEILEAFYFDYLVNSAVGNKVLGGINLAERTIYYFRERIYNHCLGNPGADSLLFSQFINLLHNFAEAAGISLNEQRADTTLFMSNIKKAGRISLAYDVLLKAVKAIPEEQLTGNLSKALLPDFKTSVLYRSKATEGDSTLEMLLSMCKEALILLENQPNMLDSKEVRIVKRFLSEQSIDNPNDEKIIPKANKDIPSSSLQSAYDEEATYRKKGNVGQSGYVLGLSETCAKDNPFQLITDYVVKPNITSDAKILTERLDIIHENTGCSDIYVDGGFHSDDVHEAAGNNNINIHLTNMTGKEPDNDKIPITDFDIDIETNKINKCPGGYIPTRAAVNKGQSSAHFPHDVCNNCPYRDKCQSKSQAKDCVVRISEKAIKAAFERYKIKQGIHENTSMRAGIEGSNSALKRKGQNKLAVRGLIKCSIVSGIKTTAQNIKRIIKYIQGGYKQKNPNVLLNGIIVPI